ncbi:hypothetical protein [Mitsuaria sp. GD03876]|uniref:hypothetical protein n=1 Tax=Mitsuaria sp. GD03876 TaxID=2975399 RepID=UPI0024489007|nr:hypothetical protein [Mitsuaria sp. GD03876]MDH0865738.1 hypothetical protein [Mitsuaria sp. GD03876]
MRLNDADELLFRQIHPSGLEAGCPCSSCFMPSKSDLGQLSVDRSSITTAEGAHQLYTCNGRASAAVYGLTVADFLACDIPCFEDPVLGHPSLPDNPAHALADFSNQCRTRQRVAAKELKHLAVSRGRLFDAS